jgi:hypothetical protein
MDRPDSQGVADASRLRGSYAVTLVQRIVSGGQTGVDRAALDVAIRLGIQHGGWCPLGRLAEDGPIPERYQLTEMASPSYADRTLQNVLDSDGTLILYDDRVRGGTALTRRLAIQWNKPWIAVRLRERADHETVVQWIADNQIHLLNVAGPRASTSPKIGQRAERFLVKVLTAG